MEDNEDNRNNNMNQTISPIGPVNKQRQIVSSTITSTSTHRHHENNRKKRKKNKSYNEIKNNNSYKNNNSCKNNNLQKQQNYCYQKNFHQDPLLVQLFEPDTHCKLIDFVGGVNYTPSSDNGVKFNNVVNFFRRLTTKIEQEKNILDFHFYLEQSDQEFCVKIIQSEPMRHPPHKRLNCLSCDTESETSRISRLPYPTTTREEVSIHHNLWLDAKARPMFIITPKRHVERLSECNDQEIFSMFLLAIQIIEQETRLSNARWKNVRFLRMTLNHGNARNVEHLHLKIRVSNKDFNHFKDCWDEERKNNFKILESGLYKRDERLIKIS